MPDRKDVDLSGTPERRRLLAVFNTEDEARGAEEELSMAGLQPQRLAHSADAAQLSKEPDDSPGALGTFARWVKGIGGEDLEAKRYAVHADEGRVVLAVPAESHEHAQDITRIMTAHGGFDVTYFSDWTIVHESPAANARHGMPTYEAATEPDEYTTGAVTPRVGTQPGARRGP